MMALRVGSPKASNTRAIWICPFAMYAIERNLIGRVIALRPDRRAGVAKWFQTHRPVSQTPVVVLRVSSQYQFCSPRGLVATGQFRHPAVFRNGRDLQRSGV